MSFLDALAAGLLATVFLGLALFRHGWSRRLLRDGAVSLGIVGVMLVASRLVHALAGTSEIADQVNLTTVLVLGIGWGTFLWGPPAPWWWRLAIPLAIFELHATGQLAFWLALSEATVRPVVQGLVSIATSAVIMAYVIRQWSLQWARAMVAFCTFRIAIQISPVLTLLPIAPLARDQLNVLLVYSLAVGYIAYLLHPTVGPRDTLRARTIFATALWFALALTLSEHALRFAARHTLSHIMLMASDPVFFLSWPLLWLTPAAEVTFFLLVAGVLVVGGLAIRALHSRRLVVLIFGFLAAFGLLSMLAVWVHFLALSLLELGIAVTLARKFGGPDGRLETLLRRSLLPMFSVVVLLPAGVFGYRTWVARAALDEARGSRTGEQDGLNLILMTLDTVRVQSLSLCGYGRETTPFLDRLADRSLLLERAICPSSWTLPTHASLFTGVLPHEHGAGYYRPLDDRLPTLAERLAGMGYETAGFVANTTNCGEQTGLARGFHHYEYYERSPALVLECSKLWWLLVGPFLPNVRRTAAEINGEFFTWLDARQEGPFFAFLNYVDAHDPYWVPDERFDVFSSLPPEERQRIRSTWYARDQHGWRSDDPQEIQLALDTYEAAILYLDAQLERLVEGLSRRGLLDNTLLVITTDHGEHFGEHGQFGHGFTLYRQEIEAPLLIHCPSRLAGGVRDRTPAALVELPHALLELLGYPAPETPLGLRLAAVSGERPSGGDVPEGPILSEVEQNIGFADRPNSRDAIRSVVADGFHYVRYDANGQEELFDFERDPLEQENLAGEPRLAAKLEKLRALLDRLGQSQQVAEVRRRDIGGR